MAYRVTEDEVRAVIEVDETIDMYPFIAAANSLTNRVATLDTDSILDTATLKEIERYLAAHCYAHRDQQYTSKSTGSASGSFQGQYGMRLEGTKWGQMALTLDFTGTLASLQRMKNKATVNWLGLPPSEQTDYVDRD